MLIRVILLIMILMYQRSSSFILLRNAALPTIVNIRTWSSRNSMRSNLPDVMRFKSSLLLTIKDVDGVDRSVNFLDTGNPSDNSGNISLPPLVILAGTAQTIGTYAGHLREISKTRRLIIPELRCQGKTELLSEHGTIQQHALDVVAFLNALELPCVDLVGFSFGGRVALAVAAYYPSKVRRLSITGVPLRRSALGALILESWRVGLNQPETEMRSCAWSFILNGYSTAFIERYADKLPSIIDQIVESNDPKKLSDLMNKSHIDNEDHPYSVPSCASRILCPTQIIASSEDRIAAVSKVKGLSDAIVGSAFVEVPGAGHLLPFENAAKWRSTVLQFLSGAI